MDADLAKAWQFIADGDAGRAINELRFRAEHAKLVEVAQLVVQAAELANVSDLTAAANALVAQPESAQAQFDFGYACIEHNISFVAIPALHAALAQVPDSELVRLELAAAYERENRHYDAFLVLYAYENDLSEWPGRYLLAYNALLAGEASTAFDVWEKLTAPEEPDWQQGYQRLRRMLARAAVTRSHSPLDNNDLRGWHFVLSGGILGTLSPFGYRDGMNGRYAYYQDSIQQCRHGLDRLQVILAAAGQKPHSVSLLPGRNNLILGTAAAQLLDLPLEPFVASRSHTLVVAYNLAEIDEEMLFHELSERTPQQILYEHATCWTDPPSVSADISTFLYQINVAPWEEKPDLAASGGAAKIPTDNRAPNDIAAEITRADGTPDPGDGQTPPDLDADLARFVTGIKEFWLQGTRDQIDSPGPVQSSRFL